MDDFMLVLVTGDLFSGRVNSSSYPKQIDQHQNLSLFQSEALTLGSLLLGNNISRFDLDFKLQVINRYVALFLHTCSYYIKLSGNRNRACNLEVCDATLSISIKISMFNSDKLTKDI